MGVVPRGWRLKYSRRKNPDSWKDGRLGEGRSQRLELGCQGSGGCGHKASGQDGMQEEHSVGMRQRCC